MKKEKLLCNTSTIGFISCLVFSLCSHFMSAQVIYNGYASVSNISGTTFTINNVNETNNTFSVNDRIIIMQMQDDVIGTNTTNVSTFGDLGGSGIKKAGLWEVATISSLTRVSGVLKTITFSAALTNAYTIGTNSSVQLITFRYLSGTAFTSSINITGLQWDGTTGLGGVIALEVQTVFTLAHTISADAIGFVGGVKNPNQFASTSCDATFVTTIGDKYAGKGEGIYKNTNTALGGARGHLLNAGGGGTDENSGGGGGSNYAAGGQGGPGYNGTSTGCTPGVGGIGGIALSSVISGTRVFLGGGGGGGHENNNVGTVGANGGGIILIKTGTLTTTGSCAALITANGGTSGNAGNDAAGGGGGGGSIIMQVQKFSIVSGCPLALSANGGSGGNVSYSQAHGAGGGGGQGTIIYSIAQPTTNMTTSTNNGTGGCNDNNIPCGSSASTPTTASGAGIKDMTSSPLPVELSAFSATRSEQQSFLQWTTLSEHKNSHFEILRAKNGDAFETIANVNSLATNGKSSSSLNYSYMDKTPAEGINYYRLKQVDVDGTVDYSPIVTVNFNPLINQNTFLVYPNPTNGDVFLKLKDIDSKNLEIDLSLMDASGRQVGSKHLVNLADGSPIALFQGLDLGCYILNVKSNYQNFNVKLIVN